jgi:hypothetical protein
MYESTLDTYRFHCTGLKINPFQNRIYSPHDDIIMRSGKLTNLDLKESFIEFLPHSLNNLEDMAYHFE